MTEISRRNLMLGGALGVVLAPFASLRASFAKGTTKRPLYRRSRFKPLRHRSFDVVGGGGRWTMKLSKIGNLPHTARGDDRSFSLTFRCRRSGPPQGSYTLRRNRFAATTLFLVPSDKRHRTYQAVIFTKPKG